MDYSFEDVLCEIMGADEMDLILVEGETAREVSSDELMGMLLDREDEFESCSFSGARLNLVMGSGEMFVDMF